MPELSTRLLVRRSCCVTLLLATCLPLIQGGMARADERPNILFVYTDDQAPWGWGASGYRQAHTPHMDRLAREGACFRNAFVTTPVCSPARASLMTSRYASEYGILDFIPQPGHRLYDAAKPTPHIAAKYRPNMYDNSLKVPAVVKWPGVVRPGTLIDHTITSLDWYPTIVEIARAQLPANHLVRGRSLVPLLKGDAPADWNQNYYGEYSMINYCRAVMRCYRTPEWKLVRDLLNPVRDELYDLKSDPAESHNLIADPSPRIKEIVEQLDVQLRRHMHKIGDDTPLETLE